MYHRIVVGTDGSRGADTAVDRAGELAVAASTAGADHVQIHLVSSYHPMVGWEMGDFAGELSTGQEGVAMVERAALSNVAAGVARLEQFDLEGLGIDVEQHAAIGAPFDVLVNVANNVDADLIVVGTRGHGAGKRLLLGSVSTKVVHHARCSVLVVHDDLEEAQTGDGGTQ